MAPGLEKSLKRISVSCVELLGSPSGSTNVVM